MIFNNIRALREDHDLTQRDMGKILNMVGGTYSKYETGKVPWRADSLIKLSDYYNVSVDYLLGLSNEERYKLNRK